MTGKDGGEYALIRETLVRDPYIPHRDLTKLHANLFLWEKNIDVMRDQVQCDEEPAESIVCVWLKGNAGVGKTRFVWWFSRYILDQRIYALPYSKEYKGWDGYINEPIVHVEEMECKNHMHASRMKHFCDFCDVSPI